MKAGPGKESPNPVALILPIRVRSLATSIDALAVGISFAFLNMTMITPTIVIAGVTFAFSLVGVYIGRQFGRRIHNFAEVVGGVILIGIGVKILLEHLFF